MYVFILGMYVATPTYSMVVMVVCLRVGIDTKLISKFIHLHNTYALQ